jgi:hypothetical protein
MYIRLSSDTTEENNATGGIDGNNSSMVYWDDLSPFKRKRDMMYAYGASEEILRFVDTMCLSYGHGIVEALDQLINYGNKLDKETLRLLYRYHNKKRGDKGKLKESARRGEHSRQFTWSTYMGRVGHDWRPKQVYPRRRIMPPNKRWPEVKE